MVPPEGPRDARWAIIGDFPNSEEEAQGRPFVGKSGQLLRKTLQKVGLNPEEAYLTHVIKTRPPSNVSPTTNDIKRVLADIAGELTGLPNCEAVLLVGNTSLTAVTGRTGITSRRGLQAERREDFTDGAYEVFATLHPAAVLRNANYYNSWVADLAQFAQLVNPPEDDLEIVWVNGAGGYAKFVDAITARGALDIETTIGNPWVEDVRLISVAVAFDENTAYVFRPGPWLDRAVPMLDTVKWTMHNGLFDTLFLWKLMDWRPYLEHDTMALQYLLNPDERKGLEILSSIHLGMAPYKTIDYDNIEDEPWEHVFLMNGRDAVATLRLFRPLADQVNSSEQLIRTYRWLLMPALRALTDVTYTGVPVDRERLKTLTRAVKGSLAESEEWLRVNTPDPDPSVYPKGWPKGLFNPRSTKQVAHVLYDQFGLPVLERTEKGAPGTSAAVLTDLVFYSGEISEPWRQQLISHRSLQKQVSSYLESWPKLLDSDDKFHPRFKPLHVVTGRLSSEHPNIQNVPRDPRYRGVFGGVKDHSWVKVDLSQIELRIAAWLAEEEAMLDALRGGYDLHAQTAELILGDTALRQTGKALNFSLLYGAYPAKLREIAARDYGVVLTPEEAEAYHRKFFETYPGLKWWHQQMEANILATGRSESPLGRIRVLPDAFLSDRGLQNKAVREGINHPVQSFASDLMLMSLVRVTKAFPGLVVATVHDELDLIVPNDVLDTVVPAVVATMEDTSWLEQWGINFDVPVIAEADIGGYWNGD